MEQFSEPSISTDDAFPPYHPSADCFCPLSAPVHQHFYMPLYGMADNHGDIPFHTEEVNQTINRWRR